MSEPGNQPAGTPRPGAQSAGAGGSPLGGGTTEKDDGAASAGPLPWLKEIIAAVLALSIAAVTLTLLVKTFYSAAKTSDAAIDAFGRKKDVLQFVLPILGAIIGYYFGRVPAERRAEQAEQTASGAQKHAESLQQSAANAGAEKIVAEQQIRQVRSDARATASRLRGALTGGSTRSSRPTLSGQTADPAAQPDLQQALGELNAWEDRLKE